jgi:hypothetical protein
MHLLTYLGTGLSLVVLSNSLPTSQPRKEHCNALIETSPWHVSDIVVYKADSTASVGSSIHFHVSDTNLGLEFDTSCGVSMPTHTGSKPEDAQGWHPCEDGRVRFFYQLGSLQLSRSYYDDWLVMSDPVVLLLLTRLQSRTASVQRRRLLRRSGHSFSGDSDGWSYGVDSDGDGGSGHFSDLKSQWTCGWRAGS